MQVSERLNRRFALESKKTLFLGFFQNSICKLFFQFLHLRAKKKYTSWNFAQTLIYDSKLSFRLKITKIDFFIFFEKFAFKIEKKNYFCQYTKNYKSKLPGGANDSPQYGVKTHEFEEFRTIRFVVFSVWQKKGPFFGHFCLFSRCRFWAHFLFLGSETPSNNMRRYFRVKNRYLTLRTLLNQK